MSERESAPPGEPFSASPGKAEWRPPQGAGALLRQMREAAGVDIALVAGALKVPLGKLQALEEDRLDELPDVTFARGLAASVCRAFGADPAPVLERMPAVAPGLRAPEYNLNQPFRRAGDRPAPIVGRSLAKPLGIGVFVALAIAAALWLLPTLPIQLAAPPDAAAPADQPAADLSAPQGEFAPPEPPASAASASAAAAGQGGDAAAPAFMPAAASAPAAAPAAPPAASAPAPAASHAVAADVLGLTATAPTWVAVRDASDKVLVNRTLAAGDTLSLGGELPLAVTIGRKDAVTVTVRGKPLDIKSSGSSSVARFTVK